MYAMRSLKYCERFSNFVAQNSIKCLSLVVLIGRVDIAVEWKKKGNHIKN